ncbi:MAG: cysteine peptidase family C39 domain-containing protein, partial [Phycisphaerae bacterium]
MKIFEQLTGEPRNTWISVGTIQGQHEEYRAARITDGNQIREMISKNISKYRADENKPEQTESLQKLKLDAIPFNTRYEMANEYTVSSVETVVYDGNRFKWEINVEKRIDSVKPDKSLEGNYMTDQFNMELNGCRVFAWDGQTYTMYSPLAEHAIVDSTGEMPCSVNGPLTAGLIPWGYGYYSYENLANLKSTAFERVIDGCSEIFLTLVNEDGSQFTFVLDPSMKYAVTTCSITGRGNISVSRYYSDFESVSDCWIPTSILLEKNDINSGKLLSRDIWKLNIDANVPDGNSFIVEYAEDTLIEYISPVANQHLIYRHSSMIDTDILLGEKLSFDAKDGTQPQNCATASMKYALGRMGIYVGDSQLAALVETPDNSTSLYAMKRFAQDLGLDCRAVKTDLEAIKNMGGCQIIFYFPGKKHFVAMESVDGEYVRIVDLTSEKFYYRADSSFFDMDWTTGIALVISDKTIEGDLVELDSEELYNTKGAVDGYSCTRLIQNYNIIYCEYVAN